MDERESDELHRPDDDPRMTRAINWCLERDLRVRRVSGSQLKLGRLNFYPVAQTLNYDGEPKMRSRGLSGLHYVLCKIFKRDKIEPVRKVTT